MARRSFDEHAALVADLAGPPLAALGTETVPLVSAAGRVTAGPVRSAIPLPPFRNSQMDGYAGRAAELGRNAVLPVAGVQPAAAAEHVVLPLGRVRKVMTGAPVPEGADVVIPVEDTVDEPGGVRILVPRQMGEYVREAGSDLAAGGEVVGGGVLLAPRHLAALAASGVAHLAVRRRPRVAVLVTGAEVVRPGRPLRFGEVYDANAVALATLLAAEGCEVVSADLVPDDVGACERAVRSAVASADLVVTSGGISQGDWEVVRQVLEPLGADVTEVAMQPGGPQATASIDGVPIVCFPGNPVSTQVSFTVLLRPVLRAAGGHPQVTTTRKRLAADVHSPAGRRQWLRGRVENDLVHVVGGPGSHLVTTMSRADVLIDIPVDATTVPAGAEVEVVPL